MFLYRHYLEIRLKQIIFVGKKLLEAARPQGIETHDLTRLWPIARKLAEEAWPDGGKEVLNGAERLIMEYHQLDSKSMSFRYPEDNDYPSEQISYNIDDDLSPEWTNRINIGIDSILQFISIIRSRKLKFP